LSSSSFKKQSEVRIASLDELKKYILEETAQWSSRCVVLLSGPMGAGKTEFVRQWGSLKNISTVSSPTYALHQSYTIADHLDLYRLNNESELETTGFWDLFSEKQGLIFIEWPEKMRLEQLPQSWSCVWYKIMLELPESSLRKIEKYVRS
jgi:tRNA threonylcarbamoyladenosine biosynthesis protein TsaE